MADFLANLVGVFAYLRINQFGIYLRGKNGFMPQYFLKGFQRHPFEDSTLDDVGMLKEDFKMLEEKGIR